MNSLNIEAVTELGKVWLDFRDDDSLMVAIITGTGDKAFCSGADLGELIPEISSGRFELKPEWPAFLKNFDVFKPIIAAVNGFCLAGGTEMLQGIDIRVASENALFSLAEPSWGLFPAAGSTVRLLRQIPYCRAMEILLTGDRIGAQEALQAGLINKVVPFDELMPTVVRIAEKICSNGPFAVRTIKESAIRCQEVPLEYAYILETYYAQKVFGSQDAKEGPKAFLEKRKPSFQGK